MNHLRRADAKLKKAWIREVRDELYTKNGYDQAEKLAAGLQRAADTPEATKLYRQAIAAKKIAELGAGEEGLRGRPASWRATALEDSLRKNLASKVAAALQMCYSQGPERQGRRVGRQDGARRPGRVPRAT